MQVAFGPRAGVSCVTPRGYRHHAGSRARRTRNPWPRHGPAMDHGERWPMIRRVQVGRKVRITGETTMRGAPLRLGFGLLPTSDRRPVYLKRARVTRESQDVYRYRHAGFLARGEQPDSTAWGYMDTSTRPAADFNPVGLAAQPQEAGEVTRPGSRAAAGAGGGCQGGRSPGAPSSSSRCRSWHGRTRLCQRL